MIRWVGEIVSASTSGAEILKLNVENFGELRWFWKILDTYQTRSDTW